MGWETRHDGKRYLYWNRRINGKPVKEYLGAAGGFGYGHVAAHELEKLLRRQRKIRALLRRERRAFRRRIDDLLRATTAANTDLRTAVEGVLHALGHHNHRGEWRMKRENKFLKTAIEALQEKAKTQPAPLLDFQAPSGDAKAVELFAKARAGDSAALTAVRAMIRERKWSSWIGDIGRAATAQLIRRASGGDPVWEAGIAEKATALRQSLLGDASTVLEELLVSRVVNGWITVYAIELEQSVRPPLDPRSRDHLDRALTRAQKRYAEAIRELARVRRLQAAQLLSQLTLASRTVVNANHEDASMSQFEDKPEEQRGVPPWRSNQ